MKDEELIDDAGTAVAEAPNSDGDVTSKPVESSGAENSDEVMVQSGEPEAPLDLGPFPEVITVAELQKASLAELHELAKKLDWKINASRTKHQIVYDLLSWMAEHGTRIKVEGVLVLGVDNFGLIRYPDYSCSPLPEDVFVPLFLVRKFQLRPSQRVQGWAKAPRDRDKYIAIDRITEVEGIPIDEWEPPEPFDKLTAMFPDERIVLETGKKGPASARIVDLVAPLGKGQRALINASPRSGKTILLKDIAKAITVNHPEMELIILLLDERPEEVTDFEESVENCQIYSSTFDETAKRHTQLAELVIERAKRLVELGKDVAILLDSITALVDTESRMDEVIFEEFKGTGNMEITLDREMAERRVFPAIHVLKSGTRKDDLLYHPDEFRRITQVRRQLAQVPVSDALELLLRNIDRTSNNAEILLMGGLK